MAEIEFIPKNPLAQAINDTLPKADPLVDDVKQSWEDLNGFYEKCANAIIAVGNSVNSALSYPGILENVNNAPELKVSVNTLKNDLETFTEELINIKAQHEDKTGIIENENELAESISIFEDYVNFGLKFQTVTTPILVNIIEKVTNSVETMKQKETPENTEANDEQE